MEANLQVIDYVVIAAAVVLSSAAGFYYGVVKKKDDSVEEYFLASRDLSTFNMACSLFGTIMSSNILVGVVAEVYYYGSQSMIGFPLAILARFIAMEIYFPVFYNVGSHDVYKYYELRFNKPVRNFLSTMTIIDQVNYCSISIYGTSAAVSKASGINVWIIILTLTSICTVYSALGGVRGVTLADVIQSFVIIAAALALVVMGIIRMGGVTEIWRRDVEGGRIEFFNFDFNPTTRHTFWTASVAYTIYLTMAISTAQSTNMRLMATNSLQKGIRASYIGQAMLMGVSIICAVLGLVTYAFYYACDPVASGIIKSPNQMISLFVADIFTGYHGFSGLFYAALICAAISTLSSMLNAMSALMMETYVRPLRPIWTATNQSYTRVAKTATFIGAALSLLGTLIVKTFPNVHQAGIVLLSISNGPHFALLTIGILFPQAKIKSALGSFGFGLVSMLWILVGSMLIEYPNVTKPVSTVGCDPMTNSSFGFQSKIWTLNDTVALTNTTHLPKLGISNGTIEASSTIKWINYFPMSTISFNWYSAIGISMTLLSFVVLSLIFGADKDRPVDMKLIPIPVQNLQKKLSKKWQRFLLCDVYANDASIQMTVTQSETLIIHHNR